MLAGARGVRGSIADGDVADLIDQVTWLGIGAIERETGLSKDTLRVWERHYGFPNPVRNLNGERVYSAEQVEKLKTIRKLLDKGKRPSRIVAASTEELAAALLDIQGCADQPVFIDRDIDIAFASILSNKPVELHKHLKLTLARLGTKQFVTEFATSLCVAVGSAWATHRITAYQEHVFSEQLQQVMYDAIANLPHNELQRPRILLTTLTNEKLKIGLLMAQAYLSVEGMHCISLGIETPVQELCNAAKAVAADVVGVSFSSTIPLKTAGKMLAELRQMLDPAIALWAGGGAWKNCNFDVAGCTVFSSLNEAHAALELWRRQH